MYQFNSSRHVRVLLEDALRLPSAVDVGAREPFLVIVIVIVIVLW